METFFNPGDKAEICFPEEYQKIFPCYSAFLQGRTVLVINYQTKNLVTVNVSSYFCVKSEFLIFPSESLLLQTIRG